MKALTMAMATILVTSTTAFAAASSCEEALMAAVGFARSAGEYSGKAQQARADLKNMEFVSAMDPVAYSNVLLSAQHSEFHVVNAETNAAISLKEAKELCK